MIKCWLGRWGLTPWIGFLGLLVSGCSVFGPVGDLVSRGYENTVSYFNAFYNAQRLFGEAEEEIQKAALVARGRQGSSALPNPIPQTARQKLTTVIEKSSQILSLYPESGLVDDALMLIGKSYYYLEDYLKAERKFTELLAQFPNSSERLDAQLWLVRTYEKLKKYDDALNFGALLVSDAAKGKRNDIASEVYSLLGDIERDRNRLPQILDYYKKALALSTNDVLSASVQSKTGDILFSQARYAEAASAYLKAIDFEFDTYLEQYCTIQAARAYRAEKRFDSSRSLLQGLLDNFRFNEYFQIAGYEYARTLMESGNIDDAIAAYRHIDTTYARSEFGAKAAFDLGHLLETEKGDYLNARIAYSRAAEVPSVAVAAQARRRYEALTQYFQLHAQLTILDSLLHMPDAHPDDATMHDQSQTSRKLAERDSAQTSEATSDRADSVSAMSSDSVRVAPAPLNKDSLRAIYAQKAYQLGEVFYSELEIPDSASYWLQLSLRSHADTTAAARILFVLADLAQRTQAGQSIDAKQYYQELIQSYPRSPYAEEARRILGLQTVESRDDPAEPLFRRAENLIDAGQYRSALTVLRNAIQTYPSSRYVPKSQYTIGWLYEYQLSRPDSALLAYKSLVKQYGSSSYATAVRGRIGEEVVPVRPDSVSTPVTPSQPIREEGTKEIKKNPDEETVSPAGRRRGSVKKINE